MPVIKDFRRTLHENGRTYFFLNVATYGALALMIALAIIFPGLRESGAAGLMTFTSLPGLSAVPDAYASGNVIAAALLTFVANVIFAALLTTTLPSLIIPFFGVVATVFRAGLIGVWLTPGSAEQALSLLPHAPIVVIELQAYVLAALGSVMLWRKTFAHRPPGVQSAWAGYRAGFRDNARLHLVVVVVLFVAAVLEAVEVIYLIPLLH